MDVCEGDVHRPGRAPRRHKRPDSTAKCHNPHSTSSTSPQQRNRASQHSKDVHEVNAHLRGSASPLPRRDCHTLSQEVSNESDDDGIENPGSEVTLTDTEATLTDRSRTTSPAATAATLYSVTTAMQRSSEGIESDASTRPSRRGRVRHQRIRMRAASEGGGREPQSEAQRGEIGGA
jgi:hypothetical protein